MSPADFEALTEEAVLLDPGDPHACRAFAERCRRLSADPAAPPPLRCAAAEACAALDRQLPPGELRRELGRILDAATAAPARQPTSRLMRQQRCGFLHAHADVPQRLTALVGEAAAGSVSGLRRLRQEVHGLKGDAGTLGFSGLQALCHDLEGVLPGAEAFAAEPVYAALQAVLAEIFRLAQDTPCELADIGAGVPSEPEYLLRRWRQVVHGCARGLGKSVQCVLEARHPLLPVGVAQRLDAAVPHLLRNAVDHGLETDAERAKSGKSAIGTVGIALCQHPDGASDLVISDDGRGVDLAAVERRALALGLLPVGSRLAEADLWSILAAPGLSTVTAVTATSGRGVGLDAVQAALAALPARIAITTRAGAGTSIRVRFSVGAELKSAPDVPMLLASPCSHGAGQRCDHSCGESP